MENNKNRKLKSDIILILVFLAAALILYLFINAGKSEGTTAVVRVNGEIVAEYPINIEGTYELNGGSNLLVIEGGKAYMIDANCPDQVCVMQGKISMTGQCITCLPNRLTVTIEGGEKEVDVIIG